MIRQFTQYLLWLVAVFCISRCTMSESNDVIILLPGQIEGKPLVLGQTAKSQVRIITHGAAGHKVVPSLILKVWWNDKIIVTENHPMRPRNKFPGDIYEVPDRTQVCWYLVDLRNENVQRFRDYNLLTSHIELIGIDPSRVHLMKLHHAQQVREKELGFKFTPVSVNRFLRSGHASPK